MKLYRDTIQLLSAVYPSGEASALTRWVLEERFGLTMADIMMDKDNDLSSNQRQDLQNITERLLQKEPIQYILGYTSFCGLTIAVKPGVLIPRPETAELVEWICEDEPASQRPTCRVLDIGTGSGCIALALASRGFCVEAWDVSPEALAIARENARQQELNVDFREQDILQPASSIAPGRQFDIIVSNPPYICRREAEEMDENVLSHEPHLALFVPDEDPLLFYRHIADFAAGHLSANGRLYFEINRSYSQETQDMLASKGFTSILVRKDQFDNPRMVCATHP